MSLRGLLSRASAGGGLRALGADSLLYGGSRALAAAFALFTFPFVARILSPEELGQFAIVQMIALPLVPLAALGQDMAVMKFLSGDRESYEESDVNVTALVIQCLGIFVMILSACVVALALSGRVTEVLGWPLFAVALLSIPAGALFSSVLSLAKFKFKRGVFLQISVLQVVLYTAFLVLTVIVLRYGAYGYTLSTAGALLVAALVGLYVLRGHFAGGRAYRKLGAAMFRFGVPYVFVGLLAVLMPFMDRAVLSWRATTAEIGVYSVAVRYAGVMEMLVIGFRLAWWPFAFSSYSASGDTGLFGRTLGAYVITAGCIVAVMNALSEVGIDVLAGDKYAGAQAFVLPLLLAGFLRGSHMVVGTGIAISGRTFWAPVGSFAGLLVGLVSALALWPVLGLVSVAWGVVVGEFTIFVVTAVISQRFLPLHWGFGRAFVLVAVLGAYLGFAGGGSTVTDVIRTAFFILIYCALGWYALKKS